MNYDDQVKEYVKREQELKQQALSDLAKRREQLQNWRDDVAESQRDAILDIRKQQDESGKANQKMLILVALTLAVSVASLIVGLCQMFRSL